MTKNDSDSSPVIENHTLIVGPGGVIITIDCFTEITARDREVVGVHFVNILNLATG